MHSISSSLQHVVRAQAVVLPLATRGFSVESICVIATCRSLQTSMQQCQPHWNWHETRSCFSARHCRTHRMTQGMGLPQHFSNFNGLCMHMTSPSQRDKGQAYCSVARLAVAHCEVLSTCLQGGDTPAARTQIACFLALCFASVMCMSACGDSQQGIWLRPAYT